MCRTIFRWKILGFLAAQRSYSETSCKMMSRASDCLQLYSSTIPLYMQWLDMWLGSWDKRSLVPSNSVVRYAIPGAREQAKTARSNFPKTDLPFASLCTFVSLAVFQHSTITCCCLHGYLWQLLKAAKNSSGRSLAPGCLLKMYKDVMSEYFYPCVHSAEMLCPLNRLQTQPYTTKWRLNLNQPPLLQNGLGVFMVDQKPMSVTTKWLCVPIL